MSTTVSYKNNTLVTVNNQTKTLKTAGKYLEDDITLVDISGGVEAVSIVDTPDAAGGTVRTITAVDISDTTAVAGDVVQGKYFYTADGTKTVGTASGGGGTPTVTGLSATYIQSGVVDVHDDLSVLIPNLVVTATISNSLQIEIAPTDYTLSGTLAVGTSTITVSYAGLTATFSVTVTQYWDYYWDYTEGVKPTGFVESSSDDDTGTIILTANGLELYSGDTSTSYVRFMNTALNSFTTKAAIEVVFSVDKSTNSAGFRCSVADGTKGAGSNTAANYIRAFTNATPTAGRTLAHYDTGTDYTLRLVYSKEGSGKYSAHVNGVMVVSGESISTMQYATNTQLMAQGLEITATVKSIRYRKDYLT